MLAAGLLSLAGCQSRIKGSEADALREDLAAANRTIAALTAERDETRLKLAEAERVRLSTGDLSAEAAAALPRITTIEIDRLSGLTDSDPDDARPFDAVEVYLRPFDGRGRFAQAVANVSVRVDLVSDQSPVSVAAATFTPGGLRDAYRSTFLSTHYTLRLPLPTDQAFPENASFVVSAELLDALTGEVHKARRVLPIARPILSR